MQRFPAVPDRFFVQHLIKILMLITLNASHHKYGVSDNLLLKCNYYLHLVRYSKFTIILCLHVYTRLSQVLEIYPGSIHTCVLTLPVQLSISSFQSSLESLQFVTGNRTSTYHSMFNKRWNCLPKTTLSLKTFCTHWRVWIFLQWTFL